MKLRRNNSSFLIEPPSCATGDIAFNLIVFFLVCASTPSNSGRKQDIPKSENKTEQAEQKENITVEITRSVVKVNGDPFRVDQRAEILSTLRRLLESKTQQQDRIVIVKSAKDAPYFHWISVTELIEEAGGIVTLQLEEERIEAVN